VVSIVGDVEVLVGLAGLVDPAKEAERIDRGLKKIDKDITVLEKRLASENFAKNAPPPVVAEARAQLEQQKRQRERLLEAKELVKEL
jgi:valyl-tRNA synthetase